MAVTIVKANARRAFSGVVGEAVSVGQLVAIIPTGPNAGKLGLASNDVSGKFAVGIAARTGTAGETVIVYPECVCVGTGLASNGIAFLGISGATEVTAPATAGKILQPVGTTRSTGLVSYCVAPTGLATAASNAVVYV